MSAVDSSDQKIDKELKVLEDKISNLEGMMQGLLNLLEHKK